MLNHFVSYNIFRNGKDNVHINFHNVLTHACVYTICTHARTQLLVLLFHTTRGTMYFDLILSNLSKYYLMLLILDNNEDLFFLNTMALIQMALKLSRKPH